MSIQAKSTSMMQLSNCGEVTKRVCFLCADNVAGNTDQENVLLMGSNAQPVISFIILQRCVGA